MTFEIAVSLFTVVAVLVLLATNRLPADALMMSALALLLLTGVVSPSEALSGFSNPGLMTVAALYVVAAALRDTGAIYWMASRLLGQPSTSGRALGRVVMPASLLSAFLNNTTVVAMMIPAVQEWAQRLRLSVSQLLLPLSYAAILGGTCTLIGTSTNLIVDGLAQKSGLPAFGIFDISVVGVPLLLVGGAYLVLLGPRLLPAREGLVEQLERAREYRVEMKVPVKSPLAGRTIRDAGLRNLGHGYLTEVRRGDQLFTAVAPDMVLAEEDRLVFIGAPDCARELQRINGLVAPSGGHKLKLRHSQRCLVEVVLGKEFPSLGKTVRDAAFRTHYQAAILSVNRHGERLSGKVGDIVLRMGDTLLLETSHTFVEQYRYRRDFMLVSPLQDSSPPDFRKAPVAVAILAGMVLVNVVGWLSVLESVFVACGALLATGCVTVNRARMMVSVNLPVLVVIGASFALGEGMTNSGAARWVVEGVFGQLPVSPLAALILIYLMTAAATELVTNNAAAVLMFPLALSVAEMAGASPMPFVVAVMIAASASFLTPLGYQTNMMVMGPGGYRLWDYLRLGIPLNIIAAVVTIGLTPLFWPF